MRRKQVLLLLVMMVLTSSAQVQNAIVEHSDGFRNIFPSLYDNPALQYLHYDSSLNQISVDYEYSAKCNPLTVETGDGANLGIGKIEAYIRKQKNVLWGEARYSNGQIRDIRRNETSDYELVYPYVMADTIGGDLHVETYFFMGGFARTAGRWTVGAQGAYSASLSSRTTDPRPKNLTSDLHISFGASCRLNGLYAVGSALRGRKYQQTNELEIYNQTSSPTIYHLTGLGHDYYRFRGENMETYYNGYGWGGTVSLSPEAQRGGLYMVAAYDYLMIRKVLSALNELPLTQIKDDMLHLEAGYITHGMKNKFGAKTSLTYERRRGTENIFGSASNNIYPQISSAQMYRRNLSVVSVEGLYQHQQVKSRYDCSVHVGYGSSKESYAEPYQEVRDNSFYAGTVFGGLWRVKDFVVNLNSYVDAGNQRYDASVVAKADWAAARRYNVFVSAGWHYGKYANGGYGNEVETTVGVEF